jgi:F-type H+-transporting ATPase subunit epsilon
LATFKLEIVTAERMIFSGDVSEIVAWGTEGQMGILPHHVPLMTILRPGDLLIKKGEEEQYMAISGGFLEVGLDKVVILADACERAGEIDIERAEAARRQAEKTLKSSPSKTATAAAEIALRRSLVRLKVARKKPHR